MTWGSEATAALPPATTNAHHLSLAIRAQTMGIRHYAMAWWFSTAHLV